MKYQNRSSNNPLKICFVRNLCYVFKQRFNKKIQQIRFYLFIFKCWRETPINIILLFEEIVAKSISTYRAIRQGSENITKYGMRNLGIPPTMKH